MELVEEVFCHFVTGVGLWNITDVLEFPSTLMEQRTLDARGVLWP